MIPAHLTNGMVPTDDKPATKAKARDKAKEYRARGIYAISLKDEDTKQYTIFVPVGVTLSLF